MKKYIVFLAAVFFLTNSGCKENSTNPTDNFIISGKIISNGSPLSNATVSLNKRVDLTTQSNSEGEFSLDNVPKGIYTLTVEKTFSNGLFMTKTSDLSVNGDIAMGSIVLPRGVVLLEPTAVNATSIDIRWTATDANDFREYKLYRHTSSGLDENTGTLIHVSTAINDTQFTDTDVNALTTYYYRVYVMNEYGHLGGSNIVSATSLNRNIIKNHSFEIASSTLPDNWSTYGPGPKFLSDSLNAEEGDKSVQIHLSLDDWGVYSWGFFQQINPSEFEQGKTYRVSFWCKTDTLEEYESITCTFTKNNIWDGNEIITRFSDFVEGPRSASDWQYFEFTLTIPTEIPSNYYLVFPLIRAGVSGYTFELPMVAWIDNVKIEKVL